MIRSRGYEVTFGVALWRETVVCPAGSGSLDQEGTVGLVCP